MEGNTGGVNCRAIPHVTIKCRVYQADALPPLDLTYSDCISVAKWWESEVERLEGMIAYTQDSYKYLGIPQTNGNHEDSGRWSQNLQKVLKTHLNCRDRIQAIITSNELLNNKLATGWKDATEVKTWNLLTVHPQSWRCSSNRWGLVSVRATI